MLIYLASPYSDPNPLIRESRFRQACAAAAQLMKEGHAVFSPVAHSHPISLHLPAERACDYEFWMAQDLPILSRCERLIVLQLEGWGFSRGVRREIEMARELFIPLEFMAP